MARKILILCALIAALLYGDRAMPPEEVTKNALAGALKTAIEEDLWFREEHSLFHPFIGKELKYTYIYGKDTGMFRVLFSEPIVKSEDDNPKYFFLKLQVCGNFPRIRLSLDNLMLRGEASRKEDLKPSLYLSEWNTESRDYCFLKDNLLPGSAAEMSIHIDGARKPEYDASDAQAENIDLSYFNSTLNAEGDFTDIYIRRFYKDSKATMIMYKDGVLREYNRLAFTGDYFLERGQVLTYEDERYFNKMMELAVPVEGTVITPEPTPRPTADSLSKDEENAFAAALKAAIEENLWFWGEYSQFHPHIGKELKCEYAYDKKTNTFKVLFSEPVFILEGSIDNYYLLQLQVCGNFPDIRLSLDYSFNQYSVSEKRFFYGQNMDSSAEWAVMSDNIKVYKDHVLPEPMTEIRIQIDGARKPEYDASDAQAENIDLSHFNSTLNAEGDVTDIYIRRFYKESIGTMVMYLLNGRRAYSYMVVAEGFVKGIVTVNEDKDRYYFDKLMEFAVPVEGGVTALDADG
ncbi:MAG: hypothetical protein LBR85_02140 [Oscillospiraceae bacterium]|jgi:hypothetical protein|nr:hypothetical protein [Oscillospiraceae bacterium]